MSDLFKDKGFMIEGILHLSPIETYELCKKGVILVDVRDSYLNHSMWIKFSICQPAM